jgi:hypothetical protein
VGAGSVEAASTKEPKRVAGEILIGFERSVPEAERVRVLARVGAREKSANVQKRLAKIAAKLVTVDPARVEFVLKRLQDDPRIRYAEPNYVLSANATPNDPSFSQLWGLHNTGQSVDGVSGSADADIDAPEAWDVATGTGSVVVGVIDTGVDFSHPDLGGSMATSTLMWRNPGETGSGKETNGTDDDGNGYVDDWRGWDFVEDDNNPFDDNGHGTHVSGTIGALGNNGTGVAGVNWNVKIMPLKFLDWFGSGSLADAVSAVLYASSKGAHVTNNSWGGGGFSQALYDAIKQADSAGSLFVAAAGNDGLDNDATPHYPSSYDLSNVVAVAASNQSDQRASFSNVGAKSVDLAAPGTKIYSTVPGGGYDWYDGTSMATPHVAGVAALAKSRFPAATGAGLKALLLRSIDPKSAFASNTAAGGRLNANSVVRCSSSAKAWLDAPQPGFKVSVGEAVTVQAIGVSCADPSGASVTVTANGTPIALTARGDGSYTGTFTPSAPGALTIEVAATAGATTDRRSVSGTAEKNYRWSDGSYSWIDATAGGTKLTLGDDASATASLPFTFSFYEQPFSSLSISSNGYVAFGASPATSWMNEDVPSPNVPNGFVAPLWDDLNPSAGGAIWYRSVGAAPNRKFVVAWVGVPHYLNTGAATFEVVLEEGTNDLVFQYQDVDFGDSFNDYGVSATIGTENLDGTVGKKFGYDQALLQPYQGAKSLRFTMGSGAPPPPADTTPPAQPTGLTATAGNGQVVLDWANNAEGDLGGYRVYRRNADGTWPSTPLATVSTSAYTDSGLANGTSYTYRVTAYDGAGNESAPSGTVSATPVAPSVPTVKSYNPAGYTFTGTVYNSTGAVSRLYSNDSSRVEIQSTTSGNPRVSELRPYASITPSERATLSKLTVNFDAGVSSENASLSFRVCRWNGDGTCTWEVVASYGTGRTSDRSFTWTTASPGAYVSPSGEIRAEVRGTRNSSSFRTRTDWVRFTIEY